MAVNVTVRYILLYFCKTFLILNTFTNVDHFIFLDDGISDSILECHAHTLLNAICTLNGHDENKFGAMAYLRMANNVAIEHFGYFFGNMQS